MPTPSTLLAFGGAAIVLVALPGPNLLYIVANGVNGGRSQALVSAIGVEAGTLLHILAAAFGLSALLRSSALAFTTVKYLGVAYLAYLGVKAFLTKPSETSTEIEHTDSTRPAFTRGLVVNVLNPKVSLFFLAFLPQFVDPNRASTTQQILILGAVFFALALAIDIAYAVGSGSLGNWMSTRPHLSHHQRRITGTIYLSLATVATVAGHPPQDTS